MKTKAIYVFIFLLLLAIPAEAQCAMCRAVLESEEGQETAKGINNGIVYLMIVPYILIGVVGYLIYKNKKKSTPLND
ncbi:hypothetical protein D1816_12760 [Aquimarina sp. AD10]|uniref:hypothetical protein n=1 Tax=Aquimarina TaxID=290174 RepID=UPI000E46DA94|nr:MULTISPECIES: hypothetical protein [Aquimarina]AXT61181.1 hypothetical protein D1816_12760 [Aquimarina sp. AD10]RKN02203.1 hypothetical protein D7033_01850 [Aquimarina sp. AD10]